MELALEKVTQSLDAPPRKYYTPPAFCEFCSFGWVGSLKSYRKWLCRNGLFLAEAQVVWVLAPVVTCSAGYSRLFTAQVVWVLAPVVTVLSLSYNLSSGAGGVGAGARCDVMGVEGGLILAQVVWVLAPVVTLRRYTRCAGVGAGLSLIHI